MTEASHGCADRQWGDSVAAYGELSMAAVRGAGGDLESPREIGDTVVPFAQRVGVAMWSATR
jgi:hypothetical protein